MNIKFNKNEDHNKLTVADLRKRLAVVHKGGGEKRIKRLHNQGKLTARERIDYLLDKNAKRIEIAAFAGERVYGWHGGCRSRRVVAVLGYVKGRACIVVADCGSVQAVALCPMTVKISLRAQELALVNKLPMIYLGASAGVF